MANAHSSAQKSRKIIAADRHSGRISGRGFATSETSKEASYKDVAGANLVTHCERVRGSTSTIRQMMSKACGSAFGCASRERRSPIIDTIVDENCALRAALAMRPASTSGKRSSSNNQRQKEQSAEPKSPQAFFASAVRPDRNSVVNFLLSDGAQTRIESARQPRDCAHDVSQLVGQSHRSFKLFTTRSSRTSMRI